LTKFSNKLSDGFGQKLEEDLNFQATQAKFLTSNGKIYSGGWKTYDDMQENFSKYCIDTAESDKRFYNYLCSVTKQDIAITKSVCESN
jgi:hypothetical protein